MHGYDGVETMDWEVFRRDVESFWRELEVKGIRVPGAKAQTSATAAPLATSDLSPPYLLSAHGLT